MEHNLSLILLDIRSAYNVGSIFRTADSAGVSKIYLVGQTATPVDRFGRKRSDIAKTALGAEDSMKWEYFPDINDLFDHLDKEGVTVTALEQDKNSIDYKTFEMKGDTALILGNEPYGIPEDTLKKCEAILEIPMKGDKESLNVAVAAGIAVYHLLDR